MSAACGEYKPSDQASDGMGWRRPPVKGTVEVVKLLIEKGCNVHGARPLRELVFNGGQAIGKGNAVHTPLMLAAALMEAPHPPFYDSRFASDR